MPIPQLRVPGPVGAGNAGPSSILPSNVCLRGMINRNQTAREKLQTEQRAGAPPQVAMAQYLWRKARADGTLAEVSRTFALHSPRPLTDPWKRTSGCCCPGTGLRDSGGTGRDSPDISTKRPSCHIPVCGERGADADLRHRGLREPPSSSRCLLSLEELPRRNKILGSSPRPGVPSRVPALGPRCPGRSITRWQPAVRNDSPAPGPPQSWEGGGGPLSPLLRSGQRWAPGKPVWTGGL